MFVVPFCAMAVYWYLLFLTKKRWNALAVQTGQMADVDTDRSLTKVLYFVLSSRYKRFSDRRLDHLVRNTRIAFGVTAATFFIYAASAWVIVR